MPKLLIDDGLDTKARVFEIDQNFEFVFDSSSEEWMNQFEMNLVLLRGVEHMLNNRLVSRGHVFLNEVFDYLDLPRTGTGAIVGWLRTNDSSGIDFGLFSSDFRIDVNPSNPDGSITLRLNVHGIIFDKI